MEDYDVRMDPVLFYQMEDGQRRFPDANLPDAIETVGPQVAPAV